MRFLIIAIEFNSFARPSFNRATDAANESIKMSCVSPARNATKEAFNIEFKELRVTLSKKKREEGTLYLIFTRTGSADHSTLIN